MDLYFANARLYDKDGTILCMYVLTEECPSVFPINGLSNIDISVDKLFIKFFTFTEDTMEDPGYEYNEFINYIKEYCEPYDKDCLLIPSLSFEFIQDMKKKLKEVNI